MTVLFFLAAIVLAAKGVWWAAGIVLVMGLAVGHDAYIREREAIRNAAAERDRQLRKELDRQP